MTPRREFCSLLVVHRYPTGAWSPRRRHSLRSSSAFARADGDLAERPFFISRVFLFVPARWNVPRAAPHLPMDTLWKCWEKSLCVR